MNITINLPVETINTIIDIDDKRVEVPNFLVCLEI